MGASVKSGMRETAGGADQAAALTAAAAGQAGDQARAEALGAFRLAKFRIGEVVRHKHFPFRGVVFDVDPIFDNTEEWWLAIPEEIRPHKDQPFYHLFAENADSEYVAYVSEQNLERDTSDEPVRHPKVTEALSEDGEGGWRVRSDLLN